MQGQTSVGMKIERESLVAWILHEREPCFFLLLALVYPADPGTMNSIYALVARLKRSWSFTLLL